MNAIEVPGLTIRAVAAAAGSLEVSNRPGTPERTIEATGFETRRAAAPGEDLFSLALAAAKKLPDDEIRSVAGVVAATFSNPDRFPSLAVRLASALGVSPSVPAFDIQMACSAYPYALYAAGRIAADVGGKVLVIDGDVQSPLTDAADPATSPLFSDAATATLVECTGGADGEKSHFAFLSRHSPALSCSAAGPVKMDGFGVFSFVAAEVAPFLEDFIASTGGAGAIDGFVPHQGNMYMARQLAKSLGLRDKLLCAGAEYANPGSCSVALALAKAKKKGRFLLAGFGAGLSAAAATVRVACAAVAVAFAAVRTADAATSPGPAEAFRNPPQSAKTGVWWHWMGNSVTKAGIVKDLDWFKRTGIGAATIFGMADVCTPWAAEMHGNPLPPLVAFTDEWWKLVRFACEEAEKRGIELGIHNCPGYTSTGGPWIPPRLAMRELVFNVTNAAEQISLKAHAPFPVELPDGSFAKPDIPARRADLQEIAVVDGVRVQHIPMGSFPQPAQTAAFGLECDKMNPEAVAFHIDHVLDDMRRHLGDQVGRGLKFVLLDSYEAGTPTWTPAMREEFLKRRGYDPLPFLPLLGGFKVSAAPDKAAEDRFKADYKRTVAELYADSLFKTMRDKLSAAGLEFACEPYTGPFDSRKCAKHVDRVMTEFWFNAAATAAEAAKGGDRALPKRLDWASWAGPDGRRHNILEAEAFTSGPSKAWPGACAWNETPCLLKAAGDSQFYRGVNRMVLHTCPHQPFADDVLPGKVMGRWGTHFGRTQTWAESGRGWFEYLNRCQALLQWGEPCGTRIKGRNISPAGTPLTAHARTDGAGTLVFHVLNHSWHSASMDMELPAGGYAPEWFDPVSGRTAKLFFERGLVPVQLPPCGAGFLVLRRVLPPQDAAPRSAFAQYLQKIPKPFAPHAKDPFTVASPWKVDFDGREAEFASLADWTASEDKDIRYFSGTAKYRTTFDFAGAEPQILSLGDCNRQIAKVVLNGLDLGTAWCEPYELLLPEGAVRQGANTLEVEFTNVWANRLIGDEQEPPDCDFKTQPAFGFPGGTYLARFPQWFADGMAARPSKGRKCFTDWNYFSKDSRLVPSGLLGPVKLLRLPE